MTHTSSRSSRSASTFSPAAPAASSLYGFLPGLALGSGLYLQSAAAVTGEHTPWRRSFLRFAADRSLLALVDGEFQFVHLLVRDHLAACDPPALADVVLRRRIELDMRGAATTCPA